MPANHSVSPRAPSPRFSLLKGEALALAGMLGAALTVFAELSPALTVAPSLAYVTEHWRAVTEGVWRPLLDLIGLAIDPGLAAAIAIAWFTVMIAAGGRFAAQVAGQPVPNLRDRNFWNGESQPWWSLISLGAICFAFLIGHSDTAGRGPVSSSATGQWAFVGIVTAAYLFGEYLGGQEFHRRLARAIILFAALIGLNFLLLVQGPTAPP